MTASKCDASGCPNKLIIGAMVMVLEDGKVRCKGCAKSGKLVGSIGIYTGGLAEVTGFALDRARRNEKKLARMAKREKKRPRAII